MLSARPGTTLERLRGEWALFPPYSQQRQIGLRAGEQRNGGSRPGQPQRHPLQPCRVLFCAHTLIVDTAGKFSAYICVLVHSQQQSAFSLSVAPKAICPPCRPPCLPWPTFSVFSCWSAACCTTDGGKSMQQIVSPVRAVSPVCCTRTTTAVRLFFRAATRATPPPFLVSHKSVPLPAIRPSRCSVCSLPSHPLRGAPAQHGGGQAMCYHRRGPHRCCRPV